MKQKPLKPTKVYVGKGLTRKEAVAKVATKATHDYRGVTYDKKTGYAKYI